MDVVYDDDVSDETFYVSIFSSVAVASAAAADSGFFSNLGSFLGPYNNRYAVCQSPENETFEF